MRRHQIVMVVVAAAAVVVCAAPPAVTAAPATGAVARAGGWGKVIHLRSGVLSTASWARVDSVSCAAPGNCVASGVYGNGPGTPLQAFVVSETAGRWGKAIEVPGLGTLNKGGNAEAALVSCASAGYCVAGGDYQVRVAGVLGMQAFLVTQT